MLGNSERLRLARRQSKAGIEALFTPPAPTALVTQISSTAHPYTHTHSHISTMSYLNQIFTKDKIPRPCNHTIDNASSSRDANGVGHGSRE